MVVIYAEKASLAKAIAVALNGGNRIAHPKEKTIGHYEFTFNGEKAVICHGVGHLCELANAKEYVNSMPNGILTNTHVFPNITRSLSRTRQKLVITMSKISSNKLTG